MAGLNFNSMLIGSTNAGIYSQVPRIKLSNNITFKSNLLQMDQFITCNSTLLCNLCILQGLDLMNTIQN